MLARWKDSVLNGLEFLITDDATFALSPNLRFLADVERSFFAGRVGAGIADLYMNSLGYIWRDNAVCLSSSLDPHADFIYAGGNASKCGVVLAEAHGSFSANVTDARMGLQAKRKYLRQVKPYVAAVSPHGLVVHGYSMAFGVRPGTPGAFLRLSETQVRKQRRNLTTPPTGSKESGDETVPTRLAFAAHRSNFILMDALPIADWIDWLLKRGALPADREPIGFIMLRYAGQKFLACADSVWPFGRFPRWSEFWDHPRLWAWSRRRLTREAARHEGFVGWFVIDEKSGEQFLNALSGMIRGGLEQLPEYLELPSRDPVGFANGGTDSLRRREAPDYDYALFRDGLALLGGPPPRRIEGFRIWSPKEGLLPPEP